MKVNVSNADSFTRRRMEAKAIDYCEENKRLLQEFAETVTDLSLLHEQQFTAIVNGDAEFSRFDLLIHLATEKKQHAKYAYLHHLETHGC
jgi:hypothetical protein